MTSPNPTPRLRPVIRVFVSSTFSDMRHERNALQERVFPKLEELCQRCGFQFQAIDLRWGVSSEAGLDHRTMRICFEELRRSQEVSPEPNFLVLLGDRYGWRPLPEEISRREFETLVAAADAGGPGGTPIAGTHGRAAQQVLADWYRCDENVLLSDPPEIGPDRVALNYILQPRTQDLGDGCDYTRTKDDPPKDAHDWLDVQQVLWDIINAAFPTEALDHRFENSDWTRHAAEVCDPEHPKRAIPQIARFQASATEQEIWGGALSAPNAERHVLAFFREIENGDKFAPVDVREFFDLTDAGDLDKAAAARQTALKAAIRLRLGADAVGSIPFSRLRLEDGKVLVAASPEDTVMFCRSVEDRLRAIIERQIEQYWHPPQCPSVVRTVRELEIEQQEHARIGQERGGAATFVGREDKRKAIRDYLLNDSTSPLVVHGASGCGKTALMARAAEEVQKSLVIGPKAEAGSQRTEVGEAASSTVNGEPGTRDLTVLRFLGTTPRSSDLHGLLASLCQELRLRYPREGELPTDIKLLEVELQEQFKKATREQPLILFLDALDQLADTDGGRNLHWIPTGPLPDHVKLVVSCLSDRVKDDPAGQPHSELMRRQLPAIQFIDLDAFSEGEAGTLLFERWLPQAGRMVSQDQRAHIEQRLASPACRQPIYLKLLFEEARLWRSYDKRSELGDNVPALLEQLLKRLSLPTNHGELLVERVLGYLAASREGLAENEILEILFRDPDYKAELDQATKDTRHEMPPNAPRIPIAIWSRLRFDLASYLTERAATGANVLTFYHRQVAEWVQERFARGGGQGWQPHPLLADYFRGLADPEMKQSWKGDSPRPFLELPFHLARSDVDALTNLLFDFNWLRVKTSKTDVHAVICDYSESLAVLPMNDARREETELVQGAFQLSSHAISDDGSQINGQLAGRLMDIDAPNIQSLLRAARSSQNETCLIPTSRSLCSPLEPATRSFVEDNPIHSLAMIESGTRLLSAGPTGRVLVRNMETGKIDDHIDTDNRTCIVKIAPINRDEHVVVSSIFPSELRIIDLRVGKTVCRLEGHQDRVNDLAVTADGLLFITASADKQVLVWSTLCNRPVAQLVGHLTSVLCVAISPNGRFAYSGSEDGDIMAWSISESRPLTVLHSRHGPVRSLAVHPVLNKIVSGHEDGAIVVWSLDTSEAILELRKHKGMVGVLRIGFDGMYLFSGSTDRSIIVWHWDSGMIHNQLTGHGNTVNDIVLTADGRFVVSASSDRTIRIWDHKRRDRTNKPQNRAHNTSVFAIGITPNGDRVLSGGADGELIFWNSIDHTSSVSNTLSKEAITSVSFFPDGDKAVTSSYDGTVRIFEVDSGRPAKTFWLNMGRISAVAITPNLQNIIVCTSTGTIANLSVYDEAMLWKRETGICGMSAVAVSLSGEYIATSSLSGAIEISDTQTGRKRKSIFPPLPKHARALSVYTVKMSPGNAYVVGSCEDRAIYCWDWISGQIVRKYAGHKGIVTGIAIDNRCRRLYSASEDATVRVWDFASGEVMAVFTVEGPICSCAVSSSGDKIAIGEQSGRIHFLRLDSAESQ